MRTTLIAVLSFLPFGASAWPTAAPIDAGAFPRDEAALRDLDNQQLRIVRRAGAQCWHSGESAFRELPRRARRAGVHHRR